MFWLGPPPPHSSRLFLSCSVAFLSLFPLHGSLPPPMCVSGYTLSVWEVFSHLQVHLVLRFSVSEVPCICGGCLPLPLFLYLSCPISIFVCGWEDGCRGRLCRWLGLGKMCFHVCGQYLRSLSGPTLFWLNHETKQAQDLVDSIPQRYHPRLFFYL